MNRSHSHVPALLAATLLAGGALAQDLPASEPGPGRSPVRAASVRTAPSAGRVDPTRLAIRLVSPSTSIRARDLRARHGLEVTELSDFASPEHRLLTLAAPVADADARLALLERLVADPAIAYATEVGVSELGLPEFPTPFVLVRFEATVPRAEQQRLLATVPDLQALEESFAGMPDAWRLRSGKRLGREVLAQVEAMSRWPGVRWVEPDRATTVKLLDCDATDCLFGSQWGLKNTGQDVGGGPGTPGIDVGAAAAWCFHEGDPSVLAVVLDNGVQLDHPDINVWGGMDFTNDPGAAGSGPVNACDNHGTVVAGVIASKKDNLDHVAGNCGVLGGHLAGVAPRCRIASARMMIAVTPTCGTAGSTEYSWIMNALQWAVDIGARVTNSSFALPFDQGLDDKYEQTRTAGVMHFGASGNDNQSIVYFPASSDSVIAVGAVANTGTRWAPTAVSGSNYGPELFCVAPGALIYLNDRTGADGYTGNQLYVSNGTSHAAPHVAGIAALMFSAQPELTPATAGIYLAAACGDLGPAGFDDHYGWGLPDAATALSFLGEYVDAAAAPGGTGTIAAPHQTVTAGANGVLVGGRVFVRAGSYDETLTITKAMELQAKGGSVVIGQ